MFLVPGEKGFDRGFGPLVFRKGPTSKTQSKTDVTVS